jgi:hypothetical protein
VLSRFRHAGSAGQADREQRAVERLLERVVKNLSDDVNPTFDAAAIELDLLVDGELFAELPHELSIVLDYGVFDVRLDGRNAIERYRDARHPSTSSHEGALIATMLAARCSVYAIDAIEEGVGVAVHDLVGGREAFVSDPAIAGIAEEGLAFVARLLTLDDLTITTGISLPLDDLAEEEIFDELAAELPDPDPTAIDPSDLSVEEAATVAAVCWRAALASFERTADPLLAELGVDALTEPEASPLWLPGDQTIDALPIVRGAPAAPAPAAELGRGSSIILPFTRKRTAAEEAGEDHRSRVEEYRTLREILIELQQHALETVSREAILEAGTRFGVLRDDQLIVAAEHELTVLMDFAIYDVLHQGQTAVERYQERRGAKLADDRRAVLAAMVDNRYTILEVARTEPETGVECRDLLGGLAVFLFDRGFSLTAQPGMLMATRLVAPTGITMTTGAPMIFPTLTGEELATLRHWIETGPRATLQARGQEACHEIAEAIVRTALEHDAGTTIVTLDAEGNPDPPTPLDDGPRPGGPRVRGKPRTPPTSESAAARRPKKKRRR